ncbi:hypothetical protein DFH06DRAFT_1145737 [Mycena polygramma]|nr:hypothetical protein DFH06DRAFT_1145737 [Mycena polygramma]
MAKGKKSSLKRRQRLLLATASGRPYALNPYSNWEAWELELNDIRLHCAEGWYLYPSILSYRDQDQRSRVRAAFASEKMPIGDGPGYLLTSYAPQAHDGSIRAVAIRCFMDNPVQLSYKQITEKAWHAWAIVIIPSTGKHHNRCIVVFDSSTTNAELDRPREEPLMAKTAWIKRIRGSRNHEGSLFLFKPEGTHWFNTDGDCVQLTSEWLREVTQKGLNLRRGANEVVTAIPGFQRLS